MQWPIHRYCIHQLYNNVLPKWWLFTPKWWIRSWFPLENWWITNHDNWISNHDLLMNCRLVDEDRGHSIEWALALVVQKRLWWTSFYGRHDTTLRVYYSRFCTNSDINDDFSTEFNRKSSLFDRESHHLCLTKHASNPHYSSISRAVLWRVTCAFATTWFPVVPCRVALRFQWRVPDDTCRGRVRLHRKQ